LTELLFVFALLLELLRLADSCFFTTPGEDDLLEVGVVFADGDTEDLAADADETGGALLFPFSTATASVVASLLALQPICSMESTEYG
jgi:hypothetical protein